MNKDLKVQFAKLELAASQEAQRYGRKAGAPGWLCTLAAIRTKDDIAFGHSFEFVIERAHAMIDERT